METLRQTAPSLVSTLGGPVPGIVPPTTPAAATTENTTSTNTTTNTTTTTTAPTNPPNADAFSEVSILFYVLPVYTSYGVFCGDGFITRVAIKFLNVSKQTSVWVLSKLFKR